MPVVPVFKQLAARTFVAVLPMPPPRNVPNVLMFCERLVVFKLVSAEPLLVLRVTKLAGRLKTFVDPVCVSISGAVAVSK